MADDRNTQAHPIVTLRDAKAAGLKRYFTGKPCVYGHVCERDVSSSNCYFCRRVATKAYRKKNLERCLAWEAAYRAANPEKHREWRAANPEKARASTNSYYRTHREKWRSSGANRRARQRKAGGNHTVNDIKSLLKVQRGKCAHGWCRKNLKSGYHIDHITPLAKGGSNDRYNLQLLCPKCNLRKSDTDPLAFARQHGMLL